MDASLIVVIAPPNPYRCPPGPYERVSMMAHALRQKGHTSSRLFVILDPKPRFSKQALSLAGCQRYYTGMVEVGRTPRSTAASAAVRRLLDDVRDPISAPTSR